MVTMIEGVEFVVTTVKDLSDSEWCWEVTLTAMAIKGVKRDGGGGGGVQRRVTVIERIR
ncbi:Transcription initiation factor TFIID subunit TAF12 [Sesbania bispinosa]|nr:Transcription initiation factor TFIID subunit TAF12 [Sesbania bispinosa]